MAADVVYREEIKAILMALASNNVVPSEFIADLDGGADPEIMIALARSYQLGYADALDRVMEAIDAEMHRRSIEMGSRW